MKKIGSIWHKWDLHYHTPTSYDYINKDKTNQEMIDELSLSGVSGVVVTDHHEINFDRIKQLNEATSGNIFFLRGIEITSDLGGSNSVHFICIFPEELSEITIRDEFLIPLKLSPEIISKKSRQEKECISVSYKDLLQRAHSIGCLISVHAGSKSNSIDNIEDWLPSKLKQQIDIASNVHILETGKFKDSEYYKTEIPKLIGKNMPTIIGSDYHSQCEYGYYMSNGVAIKRDTTWIKSDLSFDGLKQIIYEPALRVAIQERNPIESKFGIQLERLKITDSCLLNKEELNFNQDMIAVIGEKGSGKTALLDFVAHVLGSKLEDKTSFIGRAKSNLKEAKIAYKIYKDDKTECNAQQSPSVKKCRYINPTFLAELLDENNDELQKYIRDIFEGSAITENEEESLVLIEKMQNGISTIERLQNTINSKIDVQKKQDSIKANIQNLQKTRPESANIEPELLKSHEDITSGYNAEKNLLLELTQKSNTIIRFNNLRDNIIKDLNKTGLNLFKEELKNSGFPFDKFEITISLSERTISALDEYQEKIYGEKQKKIETVETIEKSLKDIEAKLYASKEQLERYEKWKNELSTLNESLTNVEKELHEIQRCENEKEELLSNLYSIYCELLNNKKAALKLYKDLQIKLMERVGNVGSSSLEFSPKIDFDIEKILIALGNYLSFRSLDQDLLKANINNRYVTEMINLFNSEDFITIEQIKPILKLIIDSDNNIYGKTLNAKSFKQGYSSLSLLNVAFNDYFTVNYEIKFNQMPIEQLSAGQKGIVLIKLLLRLDSSKEPLLIDQPEDNLDNKSVYEELVNEFKEIKQRRQLIIATHNPNLVVNTDAEQIIIAKYDRSKQDGYITYDSGALEDAFIKNQVCKILEGGKDAFVMREKRYNFKNN